MTIKAYEGTSLSEHYLIVNTNARSTVRLKVGDKDSNLYVVLSFREVKHLISQLLHWAQIRYSYSVNLEDLVE